MGIAGLYVPKISYGSGALDDLVKLHPEFARLSKVITPQELPFIPFGGGRPHAKALHAGDELLRAPLDSEIDKDVRFVFDVSIDEGGYVPGLPAIDVVTDISVTVIQAIRPIGAAMDA